MQIYITYKNLDFNNHKISNPNLKNIWNKNKKEIPLPNQSSQGINIKISINSNQIKKKSNLSEKDIFKIKTMIFKTDYQELILYNALSHWNHI